MSTLSTGHHSPATSEGNIMQSIATISTQSSRSAASPTLVSRALRLGPGALLLGLFAGTLSACDISEDDGEDAGGGGLEIAGNWQDEYGSTHAISDTQWVSSFGSASDTFIIAEYDNSQRYIVAQNAETNGFNMGLWSKFNWGYDDQGVLYYCQIAFAADTEEAALATTNADVNSLTTGCSGFPWTRMMEQ